MFGPMVPQMTTPMVGRTASPTSGVKGERIRRVSQASAPKVIPKGARTALKRGAQARVGPMPTATEQNRTSVVAVEVAIALPPPLHLLAAAAAATTSSTRTGWTGKQPRTHACRREGIWPLCTLKPTRTLSKHSSTTTLTTITAFGLASQTASRKATSCGQMGAQIMTTRTGRLEIPTTGAVRLPCLPVEREIAYSLHAALLHVGIHINHS